MGGFVPRDRGSPRGVETHEKVPRIAKIFDDSGVRLYCQERVFQSDKAQEVEIGQEQTL